MRPVLLSAVIQESRSGFWGTDPGSGDRDVRVVRNGDIQEDGLRWDSLPLRSVSHSEAERASLRKDDVLITTSGDCGYATHIQSDPDEPTIASNFIRILRFDTARVVPRFFYHVIHSRAFRANLAPYIRGTALKNLSFATAAERITVPLPSLPEQRRIADILDKADALRAKRRDALAQLDTLTQSIFFDMFGDPATNPKGWPESVLLGDVADIVSGVTIGRKLDGKATRTLPYLAVLNVQDRHLDLTVTKTTEATEEEIQRYRLVRNDLLLTEGGDPDKLGRGTLWNDELPECIHQNHVFRVRLHSDQVTPLFLNWLVGSQRGKRYFLRSAKQTTGIASINMTQLRAFPLLLPPPALQRDFAQRVSASDSLEEHHVAGLTDLDALFAALQHRAFRGEL